MGGTEEATGRGWWPSLKAAAPLRFGVYLDTCSCCCCHSCWGSSPPPAGTQEDEEEKEDGDAEPGILRAKNFRDWCSDQGRDLDTEGS